MVNILIVEDHPIVIEGLKKTLEDSAIACLSGIAQNGKECLAFLRNQTPDVILLDINLPDISGIDLCKTIKSKYPEIKVLALTTYMQRDHVNRMMENGASGYILKNSPSEEIIEGVQTVMEGKTFICEELDKLMKKQVQDKMFLSRRESEILRLIAEGFTSQEVSEKLFLSVLTIETHRKNLLTKLNARNMVSLIKIAIDNKLI
jgi:DNA-binding NarL/FixJ family response regulator